MLSRAFDNSTASAVAAVIVILALIVEMDVLHGIFTTTDLTSRQWCGRDGLSRA